jgi:hypothetical protein
LGFPTGCYLQAIRTLHHEAAPDGGQRVRERLDLVVIVVRKGVEFLALIELVHVVDYCEKLCSSMIQMSSAQLAKRTRLATPSMSEDYSADTIT